MLGASRTPPAARSSSGKSSYTEGIGKIVRNLRALVENKEVGGELSLSCQKGISTKVRVASRVADLPFRICRYQQQQRRYYRERWIHRSRCTVSQSSFFCLFERVGDKNL
jgi:hypothetical protein